MSSAMAERRTIDAERARIALAVLAALTHEEHVAAAKRISANDLPRSTR